jgi:hypothetical protein
MYASVLTKPLQGTQFVTERDGITNWNERRESAVRGVDDVTSSRGVLEYRLLFHL